MESRTRFTPAWDPAELSPKGLLFSSLVVWGLQWEAGDLGLSHLNTARPSPSSCGKDLESKAGGVWKVAGFLFSFFKTTIDSTSRKQSLYYRDPGSD